MRWNDHKVAVFKDAEHKELEFVQDEGARELIWLCIGQAHARFYSAKSLETHRAPVAIRFEHADWDKARIYLDA